MKRTHKKSIIDLLTYGQLTELLYENYENYFLQVEPVEDRYFLVEYLKTEDAEEYINSSATETPAKNTLDMEYENALTTVLNNDPQGKYSGRTLEEIFNDPNGAQWVDWALKNMHNKFILDRVKIIYNKRSAK